MGKRKFSDEDYREWARLYVEEGLSTCQIAKVYGCNDVTVWSALKEMEVEFRNKNMRKYYEDWIRLYHNGLSCIQISVIYNCHHSTVLYALKRMGINIRSLSDAKRCYQLNEHYFDVIDTERKAYFLGFICGDGYIHKNKNTIEVRVKKSDCSILEILKSELSFTGPIHFYGNYTTLQIVSRHIKNTLIGKYGVVPNKSLIIEYPNSVSSELNRHFLRGVFDADGSVGIDKYGQLHWYIVSGSKTFVESIQNIMVDELGLNRNLLYFKRNVWRLQYGGNCQVKKIYDWLYGGATVYLPRKKAVFEQVFGGEELQKGGELKLAREI